MFVGVALFSTAWGREHPMLGCLPSLEVDLDSTFSLDLMTLELLAS